MNAPTSFRRPKLWGQVLRFGIAGTANVGIDLLLYAALMHLGAGLIASKSIAFIGGTLFAFFVNRRWTFDIRNSSFWKLMPFFLLYLVSMCLNVSLNTAIVAAIGHSTLGLMIAYVAAVTASATINFIGMKWLFEGRQTGAAHRC